MILETNTTERKQLAHALAVHLGTDAVYLGPPSFAYRVGAVLIRRDGALEVNDLEALKPFLTERGFLDEDEEAEEALIPEETEAAVPAAAPEEHEPMEEEALKEHETVELNEDVEANEDVEPDEPVEAAEPQKAVDAEASANKTSDSIRYIQIGVPIEAMTISQLRNLIYTLYSKQYLLGRSVGEQTIQIDDAVVTELQLKPNETRDAFFSQMADFKAHGKLRGVDFNEECVYLTFPYAAQGSFNYEAYILLASRVVEAAKAAQRVRPKPQRPENEKYFMRGWLLRLGLGGQDFKALRKRLMRDLKGHCAFATEDEARKHREKYAELRRAERETRKDEGHAAEQ